MSEAHEEKSDTHSTLKKQELLTIIEVLGSLGVTKVRFTGGEPLLRLDIAELVREAKKKCGNQNGKPDNQRPSA